MKLIYSEIKKLLPDLKKSARQLGDDLTMIGHFCTGLEEINGKQVIDLEVRHNGGDCLGYFGLAKELSVLYDLPLTLPRPNPNFDKTQKETPVKVQNTTGVIRLMATTLTNIKNKPSPDWLKDFLALHDINSLNLLIDLTNYIMIYWGIPCHAFDLEKLKTDLVWQDTLEKKKFITFDGTTLDLEKGFMEIESGGETVSLTFIGGQNSGIDLDTKETLVEMAIYDPTRVRKDSRRYKTITEASIRLDKFLDPQLIPQAFNHLISLIEKHCQGKINSKIYNYYPKKEEVVKISFDPQKVSIYAGIKIPTDFVLKVLKNLDCSVKEEGDSLIVSIPSLRKDITLEEDLIEEAIRFWGYEKIPRNEPIHSKKTKDITPPEIYLIDHIRKVLTDLGYDEVRSWPLTREDKILEIEKQKTIFTQNNINSKYPALRTSIIPSLEIQKEQYEKYKVSPIQIFEIGKVYWQEKGEYKERYSLGLYNPDQKTLKKDITNLLTKLSADKYSISNKESTYQEINIQKLLDFVDQKFKTTTPYLETPKTTALELKKQIHTLDANISLKEKEDPQALIEKYSQKIGDNHLWKLEITDIYHDPQTSSHRYTFRASYYNLDSKKTKALHLKTFNLK